MRKSTPYHQKTRVMLINPPQRYFNNALGFNVYFPLGLLSIASLVRNICQIEVFDCLVRDFQIEKEKDYIQYGTPFHLLKQAIENFDPDVVGVTIPFSAQSEAGKAVCGICRDIDPEIVIVCGGPHPSVRYKELLSEEVCDYCVVGEGEFTFREFVEKFVAGVEGKDTPGLAYFNGDMVVFEPREGMEDLDKIPLPSYDLINVSDYLENPFLYRSRSLIREKSMSMITSRGCPFNCIFCSIKLHMGKKYRYHSVDYVIRHLEYCIENFGIKNFHFEDDNISLNKKRFEEFLDRLIDLDLGIRWDTPNGIRADTLDYSILRKIKQSGCICLQFAVESGSQRVLDQVIRKSTSLEYTLKMIRYCSGLGLAVGAFYVIGFPGETLEEINATIHLAIRLFRDHNVFPILLFATPLYGTELYSTCVENGLTGKVFTDENFSISTQFYGKPLISTDQFTVENLQDMAADFESEMNKLVGGGSYRMILTDRKSIIGKGVSEIGIDSTL